ncbi:hypothetical protein DYB30_008336 [Aphanomyces astaci]|uniref:Reverse transcriptase Ty1/copia-type domain-containing protein n=1 Tax=Aphanomyces astaci TaxID=112090 RepID=A0A397D0A6_APHAT|nr:hypothetical protein DYB30_008336 [Aphanomyces astaci]
MRAVRTPHIREMIINDSYLPWLGDDAYETYINDAPFAPFDDPELIRTLRIATPSTRGLAVFRNTKPRSVTSPRLRQRAFLAQARVQAKPSLRLDGAGRRALDEDLEGYQYDYDSFMGENTVTYPRRGVEYACEPVQVHPVPNSHREAMASPDLRHWKAAEEAEAAQLLKQIASLSWVQSAHEPCVFTRGQGNDMEILGTYVEDFIAAAPTQEKMDKVMTTLAAKIELKRQGPVHYQLGIRISRNMDESTLTMSQGAYWIMQALAESGHRFKNFPAARYATDVTFQQRNVPAGAYAEK